MFDDVLFEGVAYLGPSRVAKRDPYGLSLFAMHLQPDERPRAFLPIHDGTLLVTDRRLVAFSPQPEVHGASDAPDFEGYEVTQSIPVDDVRLIERRVAIARGGPPMTRDVEERLLLTTTQGVREIVVARGPRPVLTQADLEDLETAVFEAQAK